MSPSEGKANVTEMISRLKARLALANFKREYGYERYDLYTLETNLLTRKRYKDHHLPQQKQQQQQQQQQQQMKRHRYYPTATSKSPMTSRYHHRHNPCRRRVSYPILYSLLLTQCPLSAKRSTSPKPIVPNAFPIDDEDAANLLVMLHNKN